jgi:hypothetical protein
MNELASNLSEAGQSGLEIPQITTEIEGPAIQIIPIAVFA